MESSPKRSAKSLVRDILNDCEDITLGHMNHVVNISSASSVNSSPGNASAGELAQRKSERGRNIDRFVASVLDDTNSHNSRSGGGSPHPDNSLLSFLGETPSSSVNIDGLIDDISFEPLRPFDAHQDLPVPSKKQRLERKMKKHWKPITAACLAVALVFGISLGTSKLKNKQNDENPGSSFVGTPIAPIFPTDSPTTPFPSYSPTMLPTINALSASPTLGPTPGTTSPPTESPTSKPTSGPTNLPTGRPTMVPEYYQMLNAAKYVSGTTERSGEGGDDPFDNFTSPQSLAFHWMYFEGNPSHNILEFFEQYAVAVVFFSLTGIRQSSLPGNSLPQDDFTATSQPCGWSGVRCAYNYTSNMTHVTEIKLPMRGLKGPIPKEIGFVPYLTKLDLADNEIPGTIPEAIYSLTKLRHLYLNDNKLTGTISPQIDNLNLAEHIYLGQNYLNGTLPSNIGTNRPNNWRFFSVYDNKLTGSIPLNMRLRNAYQLDFSHNQFEGEIPSDINEENYSKLRMLYVCHNHLNGRIPSSLMEMKKMKVFYFNDNMLAGGIPEVGDAELARNLITIRAQHNQLSDPVPNGLCDLDVNKKYGELIELSVDCAICNECDLCKSRCYS
mmetsp:Transcript_33120/g.56098  ORF Transcript_33120/g.56098 Transcript_33120/m.56098 type:complete len:612 (-) Transcript_33120:27-1862(-)